MGSADALPVPASVSLGLPARDVLTGIKLRTAVAASALAILGVAGAATASLLLHSPR